MLKGNMAYSETAKTIKKITELYKLHDQMHSSGRYIYT